MFYIARFYGFRKHENCLLGHNCVFNLLKYFCRKSQQVVLWRTKPLKLSDLGRLVDQIKRFLSVSTKLVHKKGQIRGYFAIFVELNWWVWRSQTSSSQIQWK